MSTSDHKEDVPASDQGGAEERTLEVNVRRRNLIKASLATGPVILTVMSRPTHAMSINSMCGSASKDNGAGCF